MAPRQGEIIIRPVLPSFNRKYTSYLHRYVYIAHSVKQVTGHGACRPPPQVASRGIAPLWGLDTNSGTWPLECEHSTTRTYWDEVVKQQAGETGWLSYVHPEGNIYTANSDHSIVTSVDITQPNITRRLLDVRGRIINTRPAAFNADVELYIHLIDVAPGVMRVEYYCVNYQTRQIFWMDEVGTAQLGIESFESEERLRKSTHHPTHLAAD